MKQIIETNSIFHKDVWNNLIQFLTQIGRREIYGFTIGRKEGEKIIHEAIIFPKQIYNSPTRCGIEQGDFAKFLQTLSGLNMKLPKMDRFHITSWCHSHQGLTVFLSGLDKETFSNWKRTIPDLLATVVDPFDENCQVKSFSDNDTEVNTTVEDMVSDKRFYKRLLVLLKEALPDAEAIFTPYGDFYQEEEVPVFEVVEQLPITEHQLVEAEEILNEQLEQLALLKTRYFQTTAEIEGMYNDLKSQYPMDEQREKETLSFWKTIKAFFQKLFSKNEVNHG